MNKQSGFSLLEVMVVLVIIGMIMSIVAPNIMGQQEEAAIDKAHLDIQQLEDAMSLYKLKNKAYLTTEQGLEGLVDKTSIEPVPRRFPDGGFISKLPEDPWGNPFQYSIKSNCKHGFELISYGPDGKKSSNDDISNCSVE